MYHYVVQKILLTFIISKHVRKLEILKYIENMILVINLLFFFQFSWTI